jgi:hypothetical protein
MMSWMLGGGALQVQVAPPEWLPRLPVLPGIGEFLMALFFAGLVAGIAATSLVTGLNLPRTSPFRRIPALWLLPSVCTAIVLYNLTGVQEWTGLMLAVLIAFSAWGLLATPISAVHLFARTVCLVVGRRPSWRSHRPVRWLLDLFQAWPLVVISLMALVAAVANGVSGDLSLSAWLVVSAGGCVAAAGGRPLRRYLPDPVQAEEAKVPVRSARIVAWIALACATSVVVPFLVLLTVTWVVEFSERSGFSVGDLATVLVWGFGLILLKLESSFRTRF